MNVMKSPTSYPVWVLVVFKAYHEDKNPPHHDFIPNDIQAITKVIEGSTLIDNSQELSQVGIECDTYFAYSVEDVQGIITTNNFTNSNNYQIEE